MDVCLGVMGSLCCSCLSAEEMHAEICYAECLLQKATLTFVQVTTFAMSLRISLTFEKEISSPTARLCLLLHQDENMISFIKGGIKIRTSYQIYK